MYSLSRIFKIQGILRPFSAWNFLGTSLAGQPIQWSPFGEVNVKMKSVEKLAQLLGIEGECAWNGIGNR